MKKILKCFLSLLLCVIIASQTVTSVMAAGGRPSTPGDRTGNVVKYLSDLMLAYGETPTEAKKKLTEKGYTVVDTNLNPRNNVNYKAYRYVYLGYTTTTNPKLAITDISAINMNGDYTMEQYDDVLCEAYDYFRVIGEFYETLAGAFKQCYDGGSTLAKKAYEIMNMFYDPDTNKKMGDWFLSERFFRKDNLGGKWDKDRKLYKDPIVVLQTEANSDILTLLGQTLAMSVGSFNAKDNFFTRFGKMTEEKVNAAKTADSMLPIKANDLMETVQAFGQVILRAESFFEKASEYESDGETTDEVNPMEQEYAEAYYLSLEMKKFTAMGRSLYDIVTSPTLTAEDLYPVVASLNHGQYEAILITGIMSFLKTERIDDAALNEEEAIEFNNHYKEILQCCIDIENSITTLENKENSVLSIYSAVDRSVFGGSVGVTKNAKAELANTDKSNPMWGNIDRSLEIGLLCTAGVGFVTGIVMIPLLKKAVNEYKLAGVALGQAERSRDIYIKAVEHNIGLINKTEDNIKFLKNKLANETLTSIDIEVGLSRQQSFDLFRAQYKAQIMDLTSKQEWMFKNMESVPNNMIINADRVNSSKIAKSKALTKAKILGVSMSIAFGIMMIMGAIDAGMELYNYYHPDYKEIPLKIMDIKVDPKTKLSSYVEYQCVLDTDGNAADTNAWQEKEWIALYYTKDKNSGGSPLKVAYKATAGTSGYAPIHTFGATVGYNMNQFTYEAGVPKVNLCFQKGDRNLIVASSISGGTIHALVASTGILFGFGCAFGASMIVNKRKKKQTV